MKTKLLKRLRKDANRNVYIYFYAGEYVVKVRYPDGEATYRFDGGFDYRGGFDAAVDAKELVARDYIIGKVVEMRQKRENKHKLKKYETDRV